MFRIICLIIGYFIGATQTSYIFGRILKKDIRNHGSGNLGSTNAVRVLGKKVGITIFFIDVSKCIFVYFLCKYLFQETPIIAAYYGCMGVILGHDFPFYLKFKGGKGIASMIGMTLCSGVGSSVICLIVAVIALTFKYISLASLMFCVSLPVAFILFEKPLEVIYIATFLALLGIYKHKENIKRLVAGNENKFGTKKG